MMCLCRRVARAPRRSVGRSAPNRLRRMATTVSGVSPSCTWASSGSRSSSGISAAASITFSGPPRLSRLAESHERCERASAAVRGKVIETVYRRGSRLGVTLLVSHSGVAALVLTRPFSRSHVSAFPIRFQKVRSAIPLRAAMAWPEKRACLLPLRPPALKADWRKPRYSQPRSGPITRRCLRKYPGTTVT